jgi:hypothetical protein
MRTVTTRVTVQTIPCQLSGLIPYNTHIAIPIKIRSQSSLDAGRAFQALRARTSPREPRYTSILKIDYVPVKEQRNIVSSTEISEGNAKHSEEPPVS